MIRIEIQEEKQLKEDYKNRLNPLVKSRIIFYQHLFKYMKKEIDFATLLSLNTAHKQKRTLVSAIDEKASVENQAKIENKQFWRVFSKVQIDEIIDFLNNLQKYADEILISKPERLFEIHDEIYPSGEPIELWAKNMCSMIFDYSLFYKDEDNNWGFGAEYANRLGVQVCPYCNRNYITTVLDDKTKKVIGPTFDHFFSQTDYPLFLISMYNLIPSCTVCNSNLKHEKEFDTKNFLYPFDDEMGNDTKFDYFFNNQNPLKRNDPINFTIFITPTKAIDPVKELKLRGPGGDDKKGSLNVFKTEEIYKKSHADWVAELDHKCDEKSSCYATSVVNLLSHKYSREEFYRYYFANYLDKKDWNKRPLAKLTYDIVSERLKNIL